MQYRPLERVSGAVTLALCLLAASGVSAQEAPPGPVALVATVETQSIWPSFEHPARVEALDTASVRPILKGQITSTSIHPGSMVQKGELLVELDPTDYEIALAQARANLKQAEAAAVKADLDLDRAQKLSQSNTVSQREVEYAQAQSEVAQAKVEVAQALIDQAEFNLSNTKVYAPFAGRISASKYAVGDLFSPGDPTQEPEIATIVSLDPIYAVGLVDQTNYFEFLARRLRIEEAGRSIPSVDIDIILPGGIEYDHPGRFENWDNTAIASTGTIAARILFPNPDGTLLPGQNVTIRGQLVEAVEAPLVPQRAVSYDQQGHFVWVIKDDGTADRRNVEVGIRHGADWTVIDGLSEGERVVVEGLQKMRPGLTVTPKPFEG